MRPAALMFACCDHCGCGPDEREGHDDTCAQGCNDGDLHFLEARVAS